MANTELIISEIKAKANRLITEVGMLRERVALLENQLLIANSKAPSHEDKMPPSENEKIIYQPVQARVESAEDRGEIKTKINHLVKEIDRCIALLNT